MRASSLQRVSGASALFIGAASWPGFYKLIADATASPYERALRASYCGSRPDVFMAAGHCAVCWTGAIALALAGVAVLAWRAPAKAKANQPR